VDIPQGRLLKLRHDRRTMGFLSARICSDCATGWMLRVVSPEDISVYVEHLHRGSSMGLSMITRDGACYQGEACVSSVSLEGEEGSLVVLCGVGPLHND
jgi:hypothetical protein